MITIAINRCWDSLPTFEDKFFIWLFEIIVVQFEKLSHFYKNEHMERKSVENDVRESELNSWGDV